MSNTRFKTDSARCKEIRAELKLHGISNKQVSVTCKSSIRVKIKDLFASKKLVKEIAEKQKQVSYCSASGEILSGGNTFVFVDFCRDSLNDVKSEFEGRANVLIEKIGAGGYIEIGDWFVVNNGIDSVSTTIRHKMDQNLRYQFSNKCDIVFALTMLVYQHGVTLDL